MLLQNKCKMPHALTIKNQCFPLEVYPGMIFESGNFEIPLMDDFIEVTPEIFKTATKIGLYRTYAMGDVLQLIPIARQLKQVYPNLEKVYIISDCKYSKTLKHIYKDILFVGEGYLRHMDIGKFGLIISLDGMLEKDHNPNNPESMIHRVHIYGQLLGMPNETKYDWSPSKEFNYDKSKKVVSLEHDMKLIGLQVRGSTALKTLPEDFVRKLVAQLTEKYRVVLIDADANKGFEGKNIVNTCGKLDVYQCVSLLSQLDCCITMDSGILWLAHSAKCPVLTILGPTRESERLTLHPLYPQQAKSINLATELGNCTPCFESQVKCQRRIDCMRKFDHAKLLVMIDEKLKQILGEKTDG